MKKLTCALVFSLLLTSTVLAQTSELPTIPDKFLKMNYIQVDFEDIPEFEKLMKNVWKPVYREQLNQGNISAWYLYEVPYPTGTQDHYQFVTITVVDDLNKLEPASQLNLYRGSVSEKNLRRTNELREILFSELWQTENYVNPDTSATEPARYLFIDYMKVKPGKVFDYEMLEDEVAKPIHVERISRKQMRRWEVYSLIAPGGVEYGYNYATGNFYDSLKHIEFGFTEEVVNTALPETNLPELFDLIFQTRDNVSRELWRLVDYVKGKGPYTYSR